MLKSLPRKLPPSRTPFSPLLRRLQTRPPAAAVVCGATAGATGSSGAASAPAPSPTSQLAKAWLAPPPPINDESPGDGGDPLLIPVYNAAAWRQHRSRSRYWRHLSSAFTSGILIRLSVPALLSALISALLYGYTLATGHALRIAIPPQFFALSTSVLTLLLAFRTNAAYTRYVEARGAWGLVINRTRSLVLQVCGATYKVHVKAFVARWTVAFAHSLRLHMRDPGNEALSNSLNNVLTPTEVSSLVSSAHRPNYCLLVIAHAVTTAFGAGASKVAALLLLEDARALSDAVGTLERLFRAPIPPSYGRNTTRLLILWWLAVPFGLVGDLGGAAVLAAPLATYVLGAVDEIAVALEEPGGTLPAGELCDAVAQQVNEIVRRDGDAAATAAAAAAAEDGGRATAPTREDGEDQA